MSEVKGDLNTVVYLRS